MTTATLPPQAVPPTPPPYVPPTPPPAAVAPVVPGEDVPRSLRARTFDDWMSLGGAAIGAFAFDWLVFEQILAWSGTLGFLVLWYGLFLAMYAGVVGLSNPRSVVVDRVATAVVWGAAAVVVFALATTVGFTFLKGWQAYIHTNFYTQDSATVGAETPFTHGGILHAIIGTFIQVGMAIVVSVPLGIATAIYMSEVGGRLAKTVRTVVEAMTALPEILAGLFVYVVLIVYFGVPRSGFAVAVAMTVTMVPIIARASEVALRIVPGGLREAGAALGASQWQTVMKIVLPSAKAGLATAAILGVARGIGETAVVLITSGSSNYTTVNPFVDPQNSLPLYVFTQVRSGQPDAIVRAFGAASVLLTIVLILFAVTRYLSRDRTPGR